MSSIIIRIETNNAAFDEDEYTSQPEAARILHKLANELQTDYKQSEITLRDINGNTVGHFIKQEGKA